MIRNLVVSLVFLILLTNFSAAVVKNPKPGHRYFTIQFASSTKLETAKKIFKKFEGIPFLRIVKADGHYRVRGGFFSSLQEAEEFINSHEKLKNSPHYISLTVYDPSVIVYGFGSSENSTSSQQIVSTNATATSNATLEVKEENATSNATSAIMKTANTTTANATINATIANATKTESKTLEKHSVNPLPPVTVEEKLPPPKIEKKLPVKKHNHQNYYYYILPLIGLLALLLILVLMKRKKNEGVDFEVYLGKLLQKEDYDKIIEILVPYLKRNPEDTFALKALAEAMEKKGKILEAVALYRELAEVLRKKDFVVLAEEFEKKAEKLSEKAFK